MVAPELKFNSNWARHEFTGDLRGSYIAYRELPTENRPAFDGKLTGRVDVTRDTRIDLETKFLVGTDNPGSPNIQAGLAKLPIFTTWGGTAGLGHRFNRFDLSVKDGAERTVYQDSTFTDGTTSSNEDRNYNRYFTQLRGSYELTPGVKPFVEVGADRRVHDLEVDFSGAGAIPAAATQGRLDLRAHAHPDRRAGGRLARRAATRIRRCPSRRA